ncbi:hypothetical protein A3J90_00985 [candidate division WOR-1 bacterium RIFOXYC2_FULL_37_10]|uniref:Uncharacterized protein n=1 Tax=candidate division WOR-1 bacterium RIFOXYB2_FULL_37_13 TaxID=1802579 RepID=A0A1F4SU15_UNCSA|nr:MAG: hypothetical protein A2246_04225 [candidate division WOR-1 bacterium RIFOXYA2_FULL_37_7]OGC23817.1 MAG: hypothetical protein A2310_04290 [candidate division WOR-1 bacterium RIFOXYB2_FULL_37_13]OGC33283.1 MAG: hypothetical protein A3J90_00985 [candidate division WOR-1 bacterium RIFOXYC2_FULL_37_10]
MFKGKKLFILVGILVLLCIAYLFFVSRGKTVSVATDFARVGKIASYISTPGTLTAKMAELGSSIGGRVIKLNVKEGDKVASGKILATLDSYEQAKLDYESTQELFEQGFASEQQLQNARTIMENKRIVAPIDGVITQVKVNVGEIVPPGIPVITVINMDELWVEIQIDEADIASANLGQDVNLYSDAYLNQTFVGKITWINYKAELKKTGGIIKPDEENKIFRAKVSLPKEAMDKFKPGMTVNVDMLIKEKENALIIPRSAIAQNKRRETVAYVIKGNKAFEALIDVGMKDPANVEILKGLNEGDEVAASNVLELENGVKVKIQNNINNNE